MEIFASWTGPDFLAFYAVMLVTCVFLGLWIPANLRDPGRKGSVEDLEEVAVLSGGQERHTDAILADLFTRGGLVDAGKGRLRVGRTGFEAGEAERAVLAKVGDFKLSEARKSLDTHAKRVEARLIRRGLMLDAGERRKLGFLSILPYLALLVIGLLAVPAELAAGWFWLAYLPLGLNPITLRIISNYALELAPTVARQPRYVSLVGGVLAVPFMLSPLLGWAIDCVGAPPVFLAGTAVIVLAALLAGPLSL